MPPLSPRYDEPFRALGIRSMHNRYFGLRHGFSEANAIDLIVSHPAHGLSKWGLSELGRAEVTASVERVAEEGLLNGGSEIHSSDFGKLELTHVDRYQEIWREDAINPKHGIWGVEGAEHVMARMTREVAHLERVYRDKSILLVSHGDPLQILQCAFDGLPASMHRGVRTFQPGEIRELRLSSHQD